MKSDIQHPGCSEEFAELCALYTSEVLSSEELDKLLKHISSCEVCATLLHEYLDLTAVCVETFVPEANEPEESTPYSDKKAEGRLMAALHAEPINKSLELRSVSSSISAGAWISRHHLPSWAGIAAVFVLSIVGAYDLGRGVEARSAINLPRAAITFNGSDTPKAEAIELAGRLAAAQKAVNEIAARLVEAEKHVAQLSNTKKSLLSQIDQLTTDAGKSSESLAVISQQRDALQQQLDNSSRMLEQVKQDLSQMQQQRQSALLHIAMLQTEINGLRTEASKANSNSSADEEFLAQDRDIRELMGARQLYIADVFDIQNDGHRSKPFGRVFYTQGRSLIFYAFDLQAQPGYHEAKIFQAWGKLDAPSAEPISLGVFYMDSEKNRRWILKSDNPDVLARINAVFVTVEPRGGSDKPTSKPFLQAYLHSLAPNHP